MKRYLIGLAAVTALSACSGGNPFTEATETDDPVTAVPAEVARDLQNVIYDPENQTLTVTGITLDEQETSAVYERRPALDRNGYQAYSAQKDALSRHTTA